MPLPTIEISTPIGKMIALADSSGITRLCFSENMPALYKPSGAAACHLELCAEEIRLYFAGELREFTTPLSLSATAFQMNVYRVLRNIPYGTISGYGKLAAALGRPKSARAVGAANARNPVAIIVPCHRLTGCNGKLTGYAGGLWRKSRLLAMEKEFLSMPYNVIR
ncbi:MAG: methylated-DNA--[protein]-cysteine S-methyltransferase [Bacteroidetes bacterium]|nr:methylated-DNA--[protein]-cysteine S-methyltransferase [Bacteroidota bacterium]MCZ2132561.1 methylated-DNA--[protein]-cysteine S-methyltransferase [Bacteroidota bacterium]